MSGFDRDRWVAGARELSAHLRTMRSEDFMCRNPHPAYAPEEGRLWGLLAEAGVGVTPARWADWSKNSPLPHDAGAFAGAALEDVALYFVALRRAERFSEGAIGTAFDEGRIVAGLARLIELADALPYDGRNSPWAEAGVA